MKYVLTLLLFVNFLAGYAQNDSTATNYEYALIEASRQKMLGNIEEAAKLYARVINYKSDCSIAYFELGNIYTAIQKNTEAETYFEKAYNLDNYNYWYMYAYSGILKINKNYKEAIDVLRKFPYDNENNNSILFSLAECYAEINKEKKAISILNKMEKENGISEKLLLMKVGLYKESKKFDKGYNELLKLMDFVPESPQYQIIMAEYLNDFDKTEEAVKYYESAYKLDTTSLFAITNLADYYTGKKDSVLGFYYLNRALSLPQIDLEHKISAVLYYLNSDAEMEKHQDKILDLIKSLRKYYPDNYNVKTVLYDFYNKTGNTLGAYELINVILKDKKDSYILWQQALYNASILNKSDDMISLGNEALKYFPNKRDIYLFIGLGYYQNEDYENCYTILKDNVEYIKDDSFKNQFYYFMAESAYKIGFKKDSYECFEKLIKLDPKNYLAINNYSYYLSLDKVNLDRAKELSFKTIKSDPENAVFLDTYGWILYEMGLYDEAAIFVKKAIDTGVDDPDVLFHYGEILFAQKKLPEAKLYYKLALENGYDVEIIEKKISNILNEK